MANVCLRSFFYHDYVQKVSPFPRRGLFSVSQSFFVQLLASGKTAQAGKSRRVTQEKEKISSSIWRVLPNYITSGFFAPFPISVPLCSVLRLLDLKFTVPFE